MRFQTKAILSCIAVVLVAGWYWMYGPCGIKPVANARAQLQDLSERWDDAVKVAAATPIIALAGPVSKLQDLRRETKSRDVPPCVEHARNLLALHMNTVADGFLTYATASMEQREYMENNVPEWVAEAQHQRRNFEEEFARVASCAPRCDWIVLQPSADRVAAVSGGGDVTLPPPKEAPQLAGSPPRAKASVPSAPQIRVAPPSAPPPPPTTTPVDENGVHWFEDKPEEHAAREAALIEWVRGAGYGCGAVASQEMIRPGAWHVDCGGAFYLITLKPDPPNPLRRSVQQAFE